MVVHGPAVCEHCILTAQLQPSRKPRRDALGEPEQKALFEAVKQWESWLDACETSAPEGFIAAKRTGLVHTRCILGWKQKPYRCWPSQIACHCSRRCGIQEVQQQAQSNMQSLSK